MSRGSKDAESACRRTFGSGSGFLGARRDADRSSAPRIRTSRSADSPWQAGTCKSDAGPCSVATRRAVLRKGRRSSAGRLHAVHRQHRNRAAARPDPGRQPENRTRRPADRAHGQPAVLHRTVRSRRPKKVPPNARPKRPARKWAPAKSRRRTRRPASRSRCRKPTSTTSFRETGEPARFGLSLLGNDVYLEADIAWESDYHEFFTIQRRQTEPADAPPARRIRPDREKPVGLRRHGGRRRHLHHDAHAPASGARSPRDLRARLLDLAAGRLL